MPTREAMYFFQVLRDVICYPSDNLCFQRLGWNGKGMFVTLSPGHKNLEPDKIWTPAMRQIGLAVSAMNTNPDVGVVGIDIQPHLLFFSAAGKIESGWRPTPDDMFAQDWQVVSVEEILAQRYPLSSSS